MIDFALNNLPVFVNVQRQSTAAQRVILSPLTRSAIVQWHSGSISAHGVRRRDMLRLLIDRNGSMGEWIHAYALA